MAKLSPCKDCGNLCSKSARVCPKCGREFKRSSSASLLLFLVLLAGIVALFVWSNHCVQDVENAKASNDSAWYQMRAMDAAQASSKNK